jgi:hypothetical protein
VSDHARPEGATDAEVEACGRMSEALETLERARGHLLSFHQLVGETDLALDAVVGSLRSAGHDDLAAHVETEVVGRNVLAGRWTFQIVEEFDDGYRAVFVDAEKRIRDALMQGRRHVYEAEMKKRRRTSQATQLPRLAGRRQT